MPATMPSQRAKKFADTATTTFHQQELAVNTFNIWDYYGDSACDDPNRFNIVAVGSPPWFLQRHTAEGDREMETARGPGGGRTCNTGMSPSTIGAASSNDELSSGAIMVRLWFAKLPWSRPVQR